MIKQDLRELILVAGLEEAFDGAGGQGGEGIVRGGEDRVKGPGPLRVSTRPAAPRAAASVLKLPAATAVSTMSEVMACVPVCSGARCGTAASFSDGTPRPRVRARTDAVRFAFDPNAADPVGFLDPASFCLAGRVWADA
jgi:hypothetical protein